MRRTISTIFLFIAGALLGFGAYVNAVMVVPHLREDLQEISVRPNLLNSIVLALHFGTFAMIAFTAVVLFAAIQSMRKVDPARIPLAIIALTYIAFGLFVFLVTGSHHALGFVLMGLLVVVGIAIPAGVWFRAI